ncbi:MAG: autotransporter outer membrane beta-barrel domain-containing protein [Pseudomonadota bacterium]
MAHPSGTIADDPTTTGLTGWFQTSFSQSRDDVATTRLGMAHLGVDYRLTEDFLVGVMGQYDHTSQKDRANNTSADGDGWLAGPYFVTRFDDFTLDGRALWGSASNSVSPDVRISDTFRSSRELYQLGLTGRFAMSDELAILPNIRVVHFSETSDSYVNGLGAIIDRQSVHVGQMTFGPEFEYRPAMNQDFTVFFGAKGVWDFDASNGVTFTNGTTSAGSEELRLRLQASANLTVGDGVFSLSVSHDGLGQSDFAAFTAHVGYHHQF